jgi:hypothetical protein
MPNNYTDKHTGIVYATIDSRSAYRSAYRHDAAVPTQPHLDAFIPPAFLKTYF